MKKNRKIFQEECLADLRYVVASKRKQESGNYIFQIIETGPSNYNKSLFLLVIVYHNMLQLHKFLYCSDQTIFKLNLYKKKHLNSNGITQITFQIENSLAMQTIQTGRLLHSIYIAFLQTTFDIGIVSVYFTRKIL